MRVRRITRYMAWCSALLVVGLVSTSCGEPDSDVRSGAGNSSESPTPDGQQSQDVVPDQGSRAWITEATEVSPESLPDVSGDKPPEQVEAGAETRAWAEAFLQPLDRHGSWSILNVNDVVIPDSTDRLSVARLRSDQEMLSVSRQILTTPLAILPDPSTPGIEKMGRYQRLADGSELLVVNLDTIEGQAAGSTRIYHVLPNGDLVTANYVLIPAPQGKPSPEAALTQQDLIDIVVTSRGEG